MKTLSKSVTNVFVKRECGSEVIAITIPEDCYADIYGYAVSVTRSAENVYIAGIIYKNDANICTNESYENMDIPLSTSCELKKGDIVKLTIYHQFSGNSSFNVNMVINYFPKN